MRFCAGLGSLDMSSPDPGEVMVRWMVTTRAPEPLIQVKGQFFSRLESVKPRRMPQFAVQQTVRHDPASPVVIEGLGSGTQRAVHGAGGRSAWRSGRSPALTSS